MIEVIKPELAGSILLLMFKNYLHRSALEFYLLYDAYLSS